MKIPSLLGAAVLTLASSALAQPPARGGGKPDAGAMPPAAAGQHAAFRALVRFLNGPEVQQVWAPAFGASRVVAVPLGE